MDFVLFGPVRGMHQGQPVEPGRRPERCLRVRWRVMDALLLVAAHPG